jgi:hypothetical protein
MEVPREAPVMGKYFGHFLYIYLLIMYYYLISKIKFCRLKLNNI